MTKLSPHKRRPPADLVPMGVRRSPVHEATERQLVELLEQRRGLAVRYSAALKEPPSRARARRLIAIEADDAAARCELAEVREALVPLRSAHADDLANARAAAAVRILSALDDLTAGLGEMDRLGAAIGAAIGEKPPRVVAPDLAAVRTSVLQAVRSPGRRG